MKKQILITISTENPYSNDWLYASLELPAEEHEIRDAFQRARITSEDIYREYSICECAAMPMIPYMRLDSPSIQELNFLAQRLDSLNEDEKIVLQAVAPRFIKAENDPLSVKDLINLTYGLEKVTIVSNVRNTEELGEFVIGNELYSVTDDIPEDALPYLDRNKIGAIQKAADEGVFVDNYYIVTVDYELKEVYNGQQLPNEDLHTWYAFRLELMDAPDGDDGIGTDLPTRWISLPTDAQTAQAVANELGAERIEDCVYIGFESTVPQIESDHFGDMQDFEKLNNLSQMLLEMTPSDQVKFKAVLAAEEPSKIEEILDIARNLHQYEFAPQVEDSTQFFKSYMIRHMDTRFDKKWLDSLLLRSEGNELLRRIGGTITDYGIVSARGGALYEPVTRYPEPTEELDETEDIEEPEETEEQTLKMGGIQ